MLDRTSEQWDDDIRAAYRHFMRQYATRPAAISPGAGHADTVTPWLTLRVSNELAMRIQGSQYPHQIEFEKMRITWQGIPLRVDDSLPRGCFIFEEGVRYD